MSVCIAIGNAKTSLVKKAKRIGLYENFGENEIKHIEDKFIDISDYSDLMNAKRSALNEFMNWCYNYSG